MEQAEYEIEHFEFSVQQLALERRYFLKITLDRLLKQLVEKTTQNDETKPLLMQEIDNVQNAIQAAYECELQAVEALDKKYFEIPGHVLLPKDLEHQGRKCNEYKEKDEKELDEQILEVEKTFLANRLMGFALNAELQKYEAARPLIDDEMQVFAQVEESLNVEIDSYKPTLENWINFAKK